MAARGSGPPAFGCHPPEPNRDRSPLSLIAREWGRIGLTGFGGPPAHIALLRALVVDRGAWMDAREFEDANAACGLLPGPASTQLAIFSAFRVGGPAGAVIGGLGFVVPAVIAVLALSILFLGHAPPAWIRGAGAGAGAAVAAVALHAARALIGPSLSRVQPHRWRTARWWAYLAAGAAGAVALGPLLVAVLLGCGLAEGLIRRGARPRILLTATGSLHPGGLGALAWTALKVGALSFGGGFVIVPLMQSDAVHVHHWMSSGRFLTAVALGQVTPGPVVATVAAVGYAARGLAGGALAALIAFLPSFAFVLAGGRRFERLRGNPAARAFLDGAGPAAIGAILGAAILLAAALRHGWQYGVLAAAAVALLGLRRGIVPTLLGAAAAGTLAALLSLPTA